MKTYSAYCQVDTEGYNRINLSINLIFRTRRLIATI